jgi:tRNA (cmo5U34)-methyltransferase
MSDNLTAHKASDYDTEILKTIPYYSSFHTETINLVKAIKPDVKSWLDTGCGTGNLIEKGLPEFPDCRFLVADPSDNMLKICHEKFVGKPVEILGKFTTLEIGNEVQPEVITAIQSHHYLDVKGRKESTIHCKDLLKAGGLYITFENIQPENSTQEEFCLKRWGDYQVSCGKTPEQASAHLKRFGNDYFPIKISEHIGLLKNAGFAVVELFWMSYMQAGFYAIKK